MGSRPSRMWMNDACESAASSLWVECVANSVGPVLVRGRIAEHGVTIPVERVEARIGVPGFVEVQAIDCVAADLDHARRRGRSSPS